MTSSRKLDSNSVYWNNIDAVINCEQQQQQRVAASYHRDGLNYYEESATANLWRRYMNDHLPNLVKSLSGGTGIDIDTDSKLSAKVREICSVLAVTEPRESRMAKTFLTAKRLAMAAAAEAVPGEEEDKTENEADLEHVLMVLRSAILSEEGEEKELREFDMRVGRLRELLSSNECM